MKDTHKKKNIYHLVTDVIQVQYYCATSFSTDCNNQMVWRSHYEDVGWPCAIRDKMGK